MGMQRTRHRKFVQSNASNQRPSIFPQHAGKFNQPTAPPPTATLPGDHILGGRASVRAGPLGEGCSNTQPMGRSSVGIVISRFPNLVRDWRSDFDPGLARPLRTSSG
jgi:hypothetical protein